MKKTIFKMITVIIASIFAYLVRGQLIDYSLDKIIRIAGIIVAVLSVLFLIMEERMNLPFFAGKSQSAGSNANASIVVGLAVALIAQSWFEMMVGSLIGVITVLLIALVFNKKTS